MTARRSIAMVLFVLTVAILGGPACSSQVTKVKVMSLDVPPPPSQAVDQNPVIPYRGNAGPNLYVRVFRGRKSAQTDYYPSVTRAGECVQYPATDIYQVRSDGKMLHLDGVVQFFIGSWDAGGPEEQVFTLVFEQGRNDIRDGFRLSKDDVKLYFSHAVELTLDATQAMIDVRKARTAPPVYVKLEEGIKGFFRGPAVHAEMKPPPPPTPTVAPLPPVHDTRPCHAVTQYTAEMRATGDGTVAVADAAGEETTGMTPVALMRTGACGSL